MVLSQNKFQCHNFSIKIFSKEELLNRSQNKKYLDVQNKKSFGKNWPSVLSVKSILLIQYEILSYYSDKKLLFLVYFLLSILFEKTKINDDLQQYDTNPIFSIFFFLKIFFISIFITCHQKKLERPRFQGVDVLRHFTKTLN